MAGTRSSVRQANDSSPASSQGTAAGSKRKADAAPISKAKRGKKSNEKRQKTLEETMPDMDEEEAVKDVEMNEDAKPGEPDEEPKAGDENVMDENGDEVKEENPEDTAKKTETAESKKVEDEAGEDEQSTTAKENGISMMDDAGMVEPADSNTTTEGKPATSNGDAVQETSGKEDSTPYSILEKGIVYFFFRGRVGIDEPSDVSDIARSYIVLRPLPHGAKLGDGPIGDAGNNRMLALPKKILPSGPKDRFMIFVEKANCSMEEIKDAFASSDYATKTAGTRHTPAAAPIGEGVYAITTTGRESHLAYILTIPSELSEVQEDIGLRERGSFVTSVKNPSYEGPANTNLPKGPDFPQEILDEFRSLRWMPLQPKLLNYENTQFLLIGSAVEGIDKATEQSSKDEDAEKNTPLEAMEKLEHEDEMRVEHLKGNDTVFEDLGLSKNEFPKVQTTW